jgi:LmbE family N-acetylglucosaminyl deacetylase
MKVRWLAVPVCIALAALPARAQSLPEALEAIQRARVTTRILFITAHPDDEAGSLLSYLARGRYADVALLTLTRGEGGQNAIGPELGPQLAAIRSQELLEATQVQGVKLFFTRAPDFGFSKTLEETLKIWGDHTLADMVRVIRTLRPNIIINGWDTTRSGHGNHQASGYLTPKAFEAAADPAAFPDQLAEGLKPWRASLLLQPARGEGANRWPVPIEEISPIWGKSHVQFAAEALLHHRSQGVAGFVGSPFFRRTYTLERADGAAFDSAALSEPLASLAARFPALDSQLRSALEPADRSLAAAWQAALRLDWPGAVKELAQAGSRIVELQAVLGSQVPAEAQWELERVRAHIDTALLKAAAFEIEARADRSEVVAGESFTVRVGIRRRAGTFADVGKPMLVLPRGWSITKEDTDASGAPRFTVAVPRGTETLHAPDEWMLPVPPPLMRARVRAVVEGYAFEVEAPVMAQRVTSTRADVLPVMLVSAVTISVEPHQFVLPIERPGKGLEVLARVHYYGSTAAKIRAGVAAPAGWRVSPPQELEFAGPGDQLVRFEVTPPANPAAGNYILRASAQRGGETFSTSLEPLPTLPTRLWSEPSQVAVHVFDVAVPAGLRVGYVAAENDPILDALRQVGVQVELLDPVALAFGDLKRFDAIAIGIRAYELRGDLARANQRLLDYAAAGGTLVVQYQRNAIWDSLKPGPFPATMGQVTLRTTVEDSPVRFLAPDHPVLNFPNKITGADFEGWIQERGLYYWREWDSHYQPILGLRDPGEDEMDGGLLYARTGKGVYTYTGLAFFRQLPEGVPGAYRLFVNLLSQSRAKPKGEK